MIQVKIIENQEELDQAFAIREKVFIEEQGCDRDEEFDGLDDDAVQFIAYYRDEMVVESRYEAGLMSRPSDWRGEMAGTSRYRKTEKGIKLERFAVYAEYRRQGLSRCLLESMIDHIRNDNPDPELLLYLHAQVEAMPLYARRGFKETGEKFIEAGIEHIEMSRKWGDLCQRKRIIERVPVKGRPWETRVELRDDF